MFTCPICFRTKPMEENLRLTNCSHYLCWACCGKIMRGQRSLAIKCPQCRAQEQSDNNIIDDNETEDNTFDEIDSTVPDDGPDLYEETAGPLNEDNSDNRTVFTNSRFLIRYSKCTFNTINKPNIIK